MKIELTIAMLAAMAPSLGAQSLSKSPEDVQSVVQTSLDEICASPDAYKGVWVQFPLQFCSIGRVSNPFFTQFVPSQYANFYGWSIDQKIWRKPAYDDVFGTLFISKDSDQLGDVYDLELYDRIEITAVVRNVFQSRPWIEVVSMTPIAGGVNTPTLAHMFRAESHMQRRQWNRAVSELSLASAGAVPDNVLAAVHQNLGTCYLRTGDAEKALNHLQTAVSLHGAEVPGDLAQMFAVAEQNPELQLDREVEAVEVQDYERPMWEAFAATTFR